jgi:hypothetical protein
MAGLYRNSTLTIATANAEHPSNGCFQERAQDRTRPCRLKLRTKDEWRARLRGSGPIFAFANRAGKSGIRLLGALDLRAWVLQEQVLSPRVLSYAAGELYWDWATLNASESFPTGFSPLQTLFKDRDPEMRDFKEATISTACQVSAAEKDRVYGLWQRLLEKYTRRNITYEKDKIMAIMGVANKSERFWKTLSW